MLCLGFATPVFCAIVVEAFDGFFAWFGTVGRGFGAFLVTNVGAGTTAGDLCRNTVGEGIWTSIRCGDEEASVRALALPPLCANCRVGVEEHRIVVELVVGCCVIFLQRRYATLLGLWLEVRILTPQSEYDYQ